MVICPCGVMGPANNTNGAVGRRPTKIPSGNHRNKQNAEELSSNQSSSSLSSQICGSTISSDENSNNSPESLSSGSSVTVTSQPQPQKDDGDSTEESPTTTLTPSALLSKIPQLASSSSKKLTSIPVPMPRLNLDKSDDDKPKLEDKVSTSLVLSDQCGRYVGTKPVRSNVLSVQPVFNNPNRHLAGISSVPITHYDSESGISIYINPNKSVDFTPENSLNRQERRYLSQRSLPDGSTRAPSAASSIATTTSSTASSRSPSVESGLKCKDQQPINRGRPRSECGKRPIPQPRNIKEDPSDESTTKTRRYTIAH